MNRRDFIKLSTMGGIGVGLKNTTFLDSNQMKQIKIGIIGLDTSHSIHFTEIINNPQSSADLSGCQVVAAYPRGSLDIESSVSRIPEYTREMKKMGIEIVDSEEELLDKVDAVLLETNDGRRHLEQALKVFKAGKPVFIDKPLAASLTDVLAIFEAAKKYNVPLFSASSLRYMKKAQMIRHGEIGNILGAETFSPAAIEKTHPDLFWYGIHGVEILFTVMGAGCKSVVRVHTDDTDVVVGTWNDGRIGTFRGQRSGKHGYGGIAFGSKENIEIGPWKTGYQPLLAQIADFFRTGKSPVKQHETIEIYAFMEAADESKRHGGTPVAIKEVLNKAQKGKPNYIKSD